MASENPKQDGALVDLMALPLEALLSIKRKTEEEIKIFSESHDKLSELLLEFEASTQCLESLRKLEPKKDVIVPCNQMMCVRGTLVETDRVTVDIGTGYFAELSVDEAIEQFKRKNELVQSKITEIQQMLMNHHKLLPVVDEVLKKRISEQVSSKKVSDIPSSISNLSMSK